MAVSRASVTVLILNFNDWESLGLLLPELDRVAAGLGALVSVLVVDDASTQPMPQGWPGQSYSALDSIEILRLRSNQGHQRAIALGLYQIHRHTDAPAVVVMDGDGEDRPEDLPELLRAFAAGDGREVVFAARARRMESLAFQMSYQAYRLIHRALTGVAVRVGNFSVLSRPAIERLIAVPDLWNHYAASVYRAQLPRTLVLLSRGRRLAGKSKMNFVSLLIHGLSAMSVFSDQIGKRLLITTAIGIAISGWVTPTVGWQLWLGIPWLAFAGLAALRIARRRSSVSFLLARDAPDFILDKTVVYAVTEAGKASAAAGSPD